MQGGKDEEKERKVEEEGGWEDTQTETTAERERKTVWEEVRRIGKQEEKKCSKIWREIEIKRGGERRIREVER